jgi:hypothetical protein
MTDLKCPYCIETRPSRSRLQTHVDNVHREADTRDNRHRAVQTARTITNVVPDLDVPALCICGDPIQLLDEDDPTSWIHSPGSDTPCVDAVPVKRTLASQGRTSLTKKLADTGQRLDRAGDEIRELKAKADDIAARLERMDRAHLEPAAVRRATLNQVWDKLMDAGNITGAQLVMRMLGQPEGDWT